QGSDGKEFKGYGFFVQKYLWEEYRKFGLGHGHDLADFNTYHQATSRAKALEKLELEEIKISSRRDPSIVFRTNREIGNEVLEL
ncbi:hypothetical protein VWM68_11385, partial [Campylobacter coli]